MLVTLVRESVLRCFCHTCSINAPITGRHLQKKPLLKIYKKQPRCKQPRRRKTFRATEIRCEEKSRGGMCYDMILADPVADKPEPSSGVSPPKGGITQEDISKKLKVAEERRMSLEACRVSFATERLQRLEEVGRKREETNAAFVAATQAAIEEKLDATAAKRDAHLNSLKERMKEHLSGVESVRRQLESQSVELRDSIETKLSTAQENRDEQLNKILLKIKDHDCYANKVRETHQEALKVLEEKIQRKLSLAESKRVAEQDKKLEMLREHGRRAELVRANKERLLTEEKTDTPSSG